MIAAPSEKGRPWPWVTGCGMVVGLALAVRLVYLFESSSSPLFQYPVVDAQTYNQQAERIAAGNWLGRGEGPFWQPPLYVYFLALVKVFFPEPFFYAVRLLQALLGAVGCGLVCWLGMRFFPPGVGMAAGVGMALYGLLIFFDGELLPTSLATFIGLVGLVLLTGNEGIPSLRRSLAAGGVFGLAGLTVASILSFVGFGAAWLTWQGYRRGLGRWPALARGGLLLLGTSLVIAPVALRNYLIGGDGVLLSYNAGVNFYIGNNPAYERTVGVRPGWEWDDLVGLPLAEGIERPAAKSRFFFARAWEFIYSQPLAYLGLLARKTYLFWQGDEIGRNQDIYYWRNYSFLLAGGLWKKGVAFPFGLVGPLALVGLLLAVRQRQGILLAVFTAVYALAVIAFFVTARYRAPLLPVLLLFAAYGGHWILRCLQAGRWKAGGLAVLVWVAFAVPANWRLSPMNMQGDAAIHYNLGNAYAKQGRLGLAQEAFTRAVEQDSTYWQAWFNLASVQATQGQLQAAVPLFTRVLQAEPERAEIWINLAHAHAGLGNWDEVRRALQRSLEVDPRAIQSYVELIGLHLYLGEPQDARQVLEQAMERFPQERGRLGRMYQGMEARVRDRR